jgi:lycopene cyclase domain-containing protein
MKTAYLAHLLLWMGPAVLLQWAAAPRVLWANLRAILGPVAISTVWLTLADSFAIRAGIWFFDPAQCLGWRIGPWVPAEEFLFFILTSLLVAQGFVLFLPSKYRR